MLTKNLENSKVNFHPPQKGSSKWIKSDENFHLISSGIQFINIKCSKRF
jgi:hypothetical protein